MITRGFGTQVCTQTGAKRDWFMNEDGIRRWVDNGRPVDGALISEGTSKQAIDSTNKTENTS